MEAPDIKKGNIYLYQLCLAVFFKSLSGVWTDPARGKAEQTYRELKKTIGLSSSTWNQYPQQGGNLSSRAYLALCGTVLHHYQRTPSRLNPTNVFSLVVSSKQNLLGLRRTNGACVGFVRLAGAKIC